MRDIAETIGRTPVVELVSINGATVFVKLEKANPGQSMKDRMALSIVERAAARGVLVDGGLIIESSSGNAAASLAMIAAAKGYRFIAVMDHHAAREKVDAVRAYGAEVVLVGGGKPEGYVAACERREEVRRLLIRYPEAFYSDQSDNPDNALGYSSLAEELRNDLGRVDVLVGSIGSGGSLCGTARFLEERQAAPRVIAVEPDGSIIFGGEPRPYLQSGAGNPKGLPVAKNVDLSVITEHHRITDRQAFATARVLAQAKGLLLGGTAGAAVFAALEFSTKHANAGTVVVIAPDGGEKYASTIFKDVWMDEHELIDTDLENRVATLLQRRA